MKTEGAARKPPEQRCGNCVWWSWAWNTGTLGRCKKARLVTTAEEFSCKLWENPFKRGNDADSAA